MRRIIVIVLMAAALAVVGCASKPPKPAPQSEAPAAGAGAEGAGANGANAEGGAEEETGGPMAGLLATRTIYFDFDSAVIQGPGVQLVAAHAKYLAANPGARVRLEGNTDERGSREYNIGLGERRAQSVRQAMLLQGVSDGQITTVSYGEERPAVMGHNEAAWAKNRRVDIVYLAPGGQMPPTTPQLPPAPTPVPTPK